MDDADDSTPIRTRKKSLPLMFWFGCLSLLILFCCVTVCLVAYLALGSKKHVVSTSNSVKSTTSTQSDNLPAYKKEEKQPKDSPNLGVQNPLPVTAGFKNNDLVDTYMWLEQEFSTLDRSMSNGAARAAAHQRLRAKLDALIGQEVIWKFEVEGIRHGDKGKMIVYAFDYSPRDFTLSISNSGIANDSNGADRKPLFNSGIIVAAEGPVLEAM